MEPPAAIGADDMPRHANDDRAKRQRRHISVVYPAWVIVWGRASRRSSQPKGIRGALQVFACESLDFGEAERTPWMHLWRNSSWYAANSVSGDGGYVKWTIDNVLPVPGLELQLSWAKHSIAGASVLLPAGSQEVFQAATAFGPTVGDSILGSWPVFTLELAPAVADCIFQPILGSLGVSTFARSFISPRSVMRGVNVEFPLGGPLILPCERRPEEEGGSATPPLALAAPPLATPLGLVGPGGAWNRGRLKEEDISRSHWGPRFDIAVVVLMFKAKNLNEAREMITDAAAVIAPEKNVSEMAWPVGESVRLNTIKLDCLCMLWEREWVKNLKFRISRNVNPDSGPQRGWDFFAIIEERFVRDVVGWTPDSAPLGGFSWTRRRLPSSTVARGQGAAAQKTMKMVHSVILENSEAGLWPWRCSVRNYVSDQGVGEKGIRGVPMGGPDRSARDILNAIASGEGSLRDPAARDVFFLMNALERP